MSQVSVGRRLHTFPHTRLPSARLRTPVCWFCRRICEARCSFAPENLPHLRLLCVQEPEGTAGLKPGQNAAMQHKPPPDGLCGPGSHTLPAPSVCGDKDTNLNPDPGSQSFQGPGLVALPTPPPHPPLQAPPTASDRHSVFPPLSPPPCPHPDSSCPPSGLKSFAPPPQRPPRVEVRMIDFAHSTFKGFRGDTAVHDGPDRGYVFGLESLVQILESLRDDSLL